MTTATEEYEFDVSAAGLYPKQADAIFHPARYCIIEASTKSGKTHGCIVWLVAEALKGGPNKEYWWIAPINQQTKIAFNRMRVATQAWPVTVNLTEHSITLPNGARIVCQSGENPDSLYGEDVWAAVIDEGTRCKIGVWNAIRSTLTYTQGPIRIIGNVVGTRNWAYAFGRRWQQLERDGDTRYHYAKITAYDAVEAGVLDLEEVEDAKFNMDERMFNELYLAEPGETLSLIYAPFNAENITKEAEYEPGHPIYLSYDWGFTDPTHICFLQYRDGALYVFDELHGSGTSEREWSEAVVRRILELPDYEGPDFEHWVAIWENRKPMVDWPEVWPVAAGGDPSAVQMRAEFKRHGLGAWSAAKTKHLVIAGQDVLRSIIHSGGDSRRLLVHPRCKETIRSLENYRAKELSDGSFDPRPDPDPANHAYSHGCDSLRYLAWALRRLFGIQSVEEVDDASE